MSTKSLRVMFVLWTAMGMSSIGTISGQSTRVRDAAPLQTLGVRELLRS